MDDAENDNAGIDRHYYLDFAAAYVRGLMPDLRDLSAAKLFQAGRDAGLRLHRFKRTIELPRVRRVIGMLRSFALGNLLDIGSGRGVFLWPLLDAFPDLPVTALDRAEHRIADLNAVTLGGIERLSPVQGNVTDLKFADGAFDGVSILEVLEHLERPNEGAREVLRVASRFVIVSVPSKPDDNPEHLHLFSADTLSTLFHEAAHELERGIKVRCEYVLNHLIAVVTISGN